MKRAARRAGAAAALVARAAPVQTTVYGLSVAVAATLPVLAAGLTKLAVDAVVTGRPAGTVALAAGGVAATGLATVAAGAFGRYAQNELGRRAARRALADLYAATARLVGIGRFEDPASLDRLQVAEQASSNAGQLVADLATIAGGAITLIGFIGTLAAISPLAAAVVLVMAVPQVVAELTLARRRAATLIAVAPHIRREFFFARLLTDAAAAKEIRLFALAGFFRTRMLAERTAADARRRTMDGWDARAQAGYGLLGALVSGAGLVWAALAARRGALTIGDVTLFVATVAGVQSAVTAVVIGLGGAQQRLLAFDAYTEVRAAPPDLPVPAAATAPAPLRHGIELRDVWFRYSDAHPWILRGVTLTIPAGRSVALAGRNGAGKSTLVKLLCRLYDPTRGTITWDGVDLRALDPAGLRDRISAVFQDHMCYDLTAAENIAVGDLARADGVPQAARLAGADAIVDALPHGYDTPLTRVFLGAADRDDPSTGVVLSGGQWQRVALARAFQRRDRDLMILDEPSSGLDPQAEHDVHERMLRYRDGGTSLLISHRLGAVRDADLIAVLDGGVVAERGDHDTLIAAGGVYAGLFALQSAGYQAATP